LRELRYSSLKLKKNNRTKRIAIDMYTLPNKLKVFALVFMVLGAIGIVAGFLSAPKTTDEVAAMMAEAHHGEGHAAQTKNMNLRCMLQQRMIKKQQVMRRPTPSKTHIKST
jgi:hypothetical protein